MKMQLAAVVLILGCLAPAKAFEGVSDKTKAFYEPPVFSVADLQQGLRADELKRILSDTGLLSVAVDEGFETALEGLCQCSPKLASHESSIQHAVLQDGTSRVTIGTKTIGETPLPLDDHLTQSCGVDTVKAMDRMRDVVATSAGAFVQGLDRLVGQQNGAMLQSTYGTSYHSVLQIVQSANHLEHFHVYQKPTTATNDAVSLALDWHTDAGLFLAFVPARRCEDSHSPDSAFWVHSPTTNTAQQVKFAPHTVTIMLGVGAQHWLRTDVSLKATQHAIKVQPGVSRAWYGMMHLVPESSIIQTHPVLKTFADMRRNMVLQDNQDIEPNAIGCGFAPRNDEPSNSLESTTIERRRLQHVQDASACNNQTNFFCWMQCLDIPNAGLAQGYVNEGYSLYCLDPAVLASSGNRVSSAVAPCENGYVHNPSCQGSWQPTAPGVVAIDVQVENDGTTADQPFCYGGTSMYMDGFHWTHTVCIIYLFPQWVLSSAGLVVGASLGTLALGIVLEGIIFQRRRFALAMTPGYARLGVSALCYGLQLTIGYFLMLVVMTYSGPLFMCVVLGLVGGHVLLNAQDALYKPSKNKKNNIDKTTKDDRATEDGDCCTPKCSAPCAKSPDMECPGNDTTSCCCDATGTDDSKHTEEADENNVGIPEGATPCCQNAM